MHILLISLSNYSDVRLPGKENIVGDRFWPFSNYIEAEIIDSLDGTIEAPKESLASALTQLVTTGRIHCDSESEESDQHPRRSTRRRLALPA